MVGLVYFYTMFGVLLKLVGCTISNDVFPENKLGASIYKIGSFYMFSPLISEPSLPGRGQKSALG